MYADIYGQELKVGSPCRYLKAGQGCSIYSEKRPQICSSFKCVWLEDASVPDWIKPETSGMISFIDKKDKMLATVPAGGKMTAEYRAWTRAYAKQKDLLRP
jgi:Fe-S-cluster containining protein